MLIVKYIHNYASRFRLPHPILKLQCNVVSVHMIKTTNTTGL